jgi:glyoxalase family protein
MQLAGLHHVTCVCSSAQRTLDFYRDTLGFSLVKKTVNFDDPHSYHLYFGDEAAAPGTLMTFFEWPRADRGRLGRGTLESIGLDTPAVEAESTVEDPDGLTLRLYPAPAPRLRDVDVIGNPDLYAGLFADDAPLQFAEPIEEPALIGAGTTHHIAWRTGDDREQAAWLARLEELGLRPTSVQDRKYFRSIYFRMPDGMLIEVATDGPGFAVDEPRDTLGQALSLPDWLEPERATLERELTPIE